MTKIEAEQYAKAIEDALERGYARGWKAGFAKCQRLSHEIVGGIWSQMETQPDANTVARADRKIIELNPLEKPQQPPAQEGGE